MHAHITVMRPLVFRRGRLCSYRRRRVFKLPALLYRSFYSSKQNPEAENATLRPQPNSRPILTLNPTKHSNNYGSSEGSVSQIIRNYNARISRVGRLGDVSKASRLFDEMPQRDVVSYASMISVYLKHKDLPRAEKLFCEMPERNIVSDSAMIHGYAKAGRMDEARRIFDFMPERNVFSWTSLMSGYFTSGQVCEARQLFDTMPVKNTVSWTAVVLGYARNGLIDQARALFDEMPEKNVISWTAMIKSYVDDHQIDEALKLFQIMPVRNLYSWNTMIQGFLNDKRVNEAVRIFNSMVQRNAISWTVMVTGLAQNGFTNLSRKYFDQMPNRDIAAWNAMITAYVDDDLMEEASELFHLMPQRNTVTWNAIIEGYSRNGPEAESLKHLILMLRSCNRPNETTLTSILTSCHGVVDLLQSHALVIRYGFEHETSLSNALVTMYSKTGDVISARLAFENLEAKDTVSWTAMILAYSHHGFANHALEVFARMIRSGANPDGITFIGILSACSHAGLVKKGRRLFDAMMHVYGFEPKSEHYSCLVDILGRAGQVDNAMNVVLEMPPSELDAAVLGALLGACKLHGDIELANRIGEKLIELEPSSSGAYVLLANAYAACGKWLEFAQVRKTMKERKVQKIPGFSQIDVQGKNHVFFVGDKSHPAVEEIYILLREKLLPLMQEMGYSMGSVGVVL